MTLSRRHFLATAAALPFATPALAAGIPLHVVKDPNCGCCGAWIDIMAAEGFDVTVEHAIGADLVNYKVANGIPLELSSCHTASVNGYMIEGHVPPADVKRLLDTAPDAIGLTVPDMPFGSPGMGPEDQRDTYQVILIKRDGAEVFANYDAA